MKCNEVYETLYSSADTQPEMLQLMQKVGSLIGRNSLLEVAKKGDVSAGLHI